MHTLQMMVRRLVTQMAKPELDHMLDTVFEIHRYVSLQPSYKVSHNEQQKATGQHFSSVSSGQALAE
jgi:hypothetical protein